MENPEYGTHGLQLIKVKVKVTQSCPTLCDPMDYTVHGILQARILEWVAFPFSRRSSWPRNRSGVSCIAGGFFTKWAIREVDRWLKAQLYWESLTDFNHISTSKCDWSLIKISHFHSLHTHFCCSVAQSFSTLCSLMNCTKPGFLAFHYLPEFAQTNFHWVNNTIQPSHPLSPLSSPAINLSPHQDLF